jgi:hypothetical protein
MQTRKVEVEMSKKDKIFLLIVKINKLEKVSNKECKCNVRFGKDESELCSKCTAVADLIDIEERLDDCLSL